MDDKNKEIIDFSNQPLGLMAQEGAKIEDNLNSEYHMNEAKRNNAGTQDNPFADVTFGKKEVAPVLDNKPIVSNEVQNMPTTPVEQPTPVVPPTEPPKEEAPVTKPVPEEERKQQLMNELMSGGKKEEVISNGVEEQPGSWGIFVFLFLVALVAGAIFIFKSGKLDSFLNKQEEESSGVQYKEETPSSDVPATPVEPEKVKNYKTKQTIYIAMNDTFNNTSTGTVDLESNAGKFITTVSYNGLTSHNIEEYCDYSAGYSYTQDFNDKTKWSKGQFEPVYLGPESKLEFLKSLGEAKEVSPGLYKIDVTVKDMMKMVMDTEGLNKKDINLNATISIEYTVKDGYLVKVKMDITQAVKNVKKYIIAIEMSDFNQATDHINVPEDIIAKAK